jgi:hypothetical protein
MGHHIVDELFFAVLLGICENATFMDCAVEAKLIPGSHFKEALATLTYVHNPIFNL